MNSPFFSAWSTSSVGSTTIIRVPTDLRGSNTRLSTAPPLAVLPKAHRPSLEELDTQYAVLAWHRACRCHPSEEYRNTSCIFWMHAERQICPVHGHRLHRGHPS